MGNITCHCAPLRVSAVHPHTCGEHATLCVCLMGKRGSSPHLWGTLFTTSPSNRIIRFIPTPVGNIKGRQVESSNLPVHPHTCGEHRPHRHIAHSTHGSSPHLWGTYSVEDVERISNRFIPTPVGNIAIMPCRPDKAPVHPHTCGEHIFII